MSRRKLMLTVISAALACLAMTAEAAVTDYAQYVPGDFLLYYGFPYSAETAAKIDAAPSSKIMQDEQFMKVMDEFFASMPMKVEKDNPASKAGLTWKDLFALKHGGFAIALNVKMVEMKMKMEGLPPGTKLPMMPQVEGAIYADKSNAEIKPVLDKVIKAMDIASEPGPNKAVDKKEVNIAGVKAVFYADLNPGMSGVTGIYLFEQGDMTVFATDEALAEKIINYINGKGDDSLAKSDLYTKAMAKLGDKRLNAMFLNAGESVARFQKQVEQQPDAAGVMKALNFDSLKAIVGADWMDENGAMSQIYLYCPDGKFGLLKPLQSGRANFATLDGVGKKSFAFASVSVEPVGLWNWFVSILKDTDKAKYDSFNKDLQDSEKSMGVKVEDILAALGGEMTIVMTSPSLQGDAKGLPVPVALVAELKDKAKAEQIVAKIYETQKLKPEIEEYGTAKHQINILPTAAVCMTDKYCIIANGSRTMGEVLDTMDGEGAKMTDADHFKKATALLGGNNAALFYVNMKDVANVMENLEKWQDAIGGGIGKPQGPNPPEGMDGEEVPAPDTPFALAALAVFIRDGGTTPAPPEAKPEEGSADADSEDAGLSEEGPTEEDANLDEQDTNNEEVVPNGEEEPLPPENFPMPPHHGGKDKEMLTKVAALLKVMSNYTPAMYVGVAADNEGMSIKMVIP